MDPLAPMDPLGTMAPSTPGTVHPNHSHIGDGPDTLCSAVLGTLPPIHPREDTMGQHIEDAAGAAIIFAFIYLLMSL